MENYLGLNTWLTQRAMARVLGTSQQNISTHVRSILEENKDYGDIFVRKMKPDNIAKAMRRKYYHQIFLEMVASKVNTNAARKFLELARRAKRRTGLKMCLITE